MSKITRPISKEEINCYQKNGVVLLRGVLDLKTVNTLRKCIDDAVTTFEKSPSGYNLTAITNAAEKGNLKSLEDLNGNQYDVTGIVEYIKSTGKPLLTERQSAEHEGQFILDTGVVSRLKEFQKFTQKGAMIEIASSLLNSDQVNFFGDQVFVKEPMTKERTAFHQDASYFEIEGDDCCVLWVPVDPVTLENGAMLYIRGSHKGTELYQPNTFISQAALPGSEGTVLPNIEDNLDDYDVIHFDVEPGDVLVHHYKTIHGTGGNQSSYQVRRAASLRYSGDDIRFKSRPGVPKQLHHTHQLKDGDPLSGVDFPVVWRRPVQKDAA